ncbi:MAG: replication-associated recombination protein A [Candidatus Kapaibacteriota bacterium]
MEILFGDNTKKSGGSLPPLAERMRPRFIDDVLGQEHILGINSPLKKMINEGTIPSIILWGPPGCGKTTLANCISNEIKADFIRLSAVESGVKEIREVIQKAEFNLKSNKKTILFIDEIHRFNKGQQDALLHSVETGTLTLIGATTENPSFEVNPALISRMQVYHLHPLSEEDIVKLITNAIQKDEILSNFNFEIENISRFYELSAGDARVSLNILENSFKLAKKTDDKTIKITEEIIQSAIQRKVLSYDKKGENHYDNISAFIKSLRGSDPDAAMLWMVKMLEAGEDPLFIARRMVIFASEDIGNAEPMALTVAVSVFQAVQMIGMPEASINLANGVTFLASCAKSNASYLALEKAREIVKNSPDLSPPLHLRNAPTKLMKQEGYSKDYKYPHSFPEHFVPENYFPINFQPQQFYFPTNEGKEAKIRERLKSLWVNIKKY